MTNTSSSSEAPYIHISKLDAAKRQLEIAVRLFFKSEDIVSIHTLTAAAHEVLTDLCTKQGKTSYLKHEAKKFLKPEKCKDWYKMITDAENFFKHAVRDPDDILKFYYKATEYLLLDAVVMYIKLTNENPPYFRIYSTWFYAAHSDLIVDEKYREIAKILATRLDPNNKADYLNLLPNIDSV